MIEKGISQTLHLRPQKILVVGCGSVGLRHIRNLRALGQNEILACASRGYGLPEAKALGAVPFERLEDAWQERPEIVLVCNATHLHLSTARTAIELGAHVFIEKPIAHRPEGVAELIQEAENKNRIVMVGYNLRFHPVLQTVQELLRQKVIGPILSVRVEMGQFLPTWRKGRDYRQSYTAHRDQGGGIVLDMSHELDYLMWLFGPVKQVVCFAEHLSSLDVDVEDIACMLLKFRDGAMGEVHLDFVQRGYFRNGKAIGDRGIITWEFTAPAVEFRAEQDAEWREVSFRGYDPNQMYLDEMTHFLTCAQEGTPPLIGAKEGEQVLSLATAALHSAAVGKVVEL